MADFEMRLLGRFDLVHRSRGAVHVPPGRLRALLGRLAFRPGRSRTRGDLADLLWSGRPEQVARHSLNQALSHLRKIAGQDLFVQDGENLALDPRMLSTDVDAVRHLVREGSPETLRKAIELCRGAFLEGHGGSRPEFEDWLRTARAEVDALVISAHEGLLAAVPVPDSPESAAAIAARLAKVDPLNERAHRGLIEAAAAQGETGRAVRIYEDFRRRLARELGIAPEEETEQLVRSLRRSRLEVIASDKESRNREQTPRQLTANCPTVLVLPPRAIGEASHGLAVADGVAHDLITELARFHSLDVIAAETALACRDSALSPAELARRFAADYVLTGGIRCNASSARFSLQLLGIASGRQLWSEHYDCALGELFDVRADVISGIVGSVANLVEFDLMRRLRRKPTDSWDAYDHFLRGIDIYYRRWSALDAPLAVKPYFEKAIELDPYFARAHAFLACVNGHKCQTDRVDDDFGVSIDGARRAIALDPLEADAPRVLGAIYVTIGYHEEGYPHLVRAIRLNPGHADLAAHMCRYHGLTGNPTRALEAIRRAHRLNPLSPDWYWSLEALAYHARGDYSEALAAIRQVRAPNATEYLYAAACHAAMGETEEARSAMKRALTDRPGLDRKSVALYLPYKDPAKREEIIDQFARAGLP